MASDEVFRFLGGAGIATLGVIAKHLRFVDKLFASRSQPLVCPACGAALRKLDDVAAKP
jgi:hypothetical protein